jgi:hypothetical protein
MINILLLDESMSTIKTPNKKLTSVISIMYSDGVVILHRECVVVVVTPFSQVNL